MKKNTLVVAATLLALSSVFIAHAGADDAWPPAPVSGVPATQDTPVAALNDTTVVAKLDTARDSIQPELGATAYTISGDGIDATAKGFAASVTDLLARAPGVAQDGSGSGSIHVRGEHANLQYRVNGVLLPESFSGFGLELDSRFIDRMRLITGSLPAQYGFRTAGIVDITTRAGSMLSGGELEAYFGSNDTFRLGGAYGDSTGSADVFVSGSYLHSALGIENPTSSHAAVHDDTDQYKSFASVSWLLDDVSRLSFMAGGSYSDYQLPDTPGLPAGTSPNGDPRVPGSFDSTKLDERQNERNYFGTLTWQRSDEYSDIQVSGLARRSSIHFMPDVPGDLYFNGVASDVDRGLDSGGLQLDAKADIDTDHTLRFGGQILGTFVDTDTTTTVFPVDANGNPTGPALPIVDKENTNALFAGVYLQDEWRALSNVTVNFGARFDSYSSSTDNETQLSPRLNVIWKATKTTTFHAGYARYFTPPPLENVSSGTLAKFDGTSNAAAVSQNDPVKAERSHYFDAGVVQKIGDGFQVGVDGYYKIATNQLDDGYFGQSLIPSTFNYAHGEVYGIELTASYKIENFSLYANAAYSVARGKDWNSAQFLFSPADLAYSQNHWIHLDHDQTCTATTGASYTWKQGADSSTRFFAEVLFGSGLRTDSVTASGGDVPNGGHVPAYCTMNLGVEQLVKLAPTHTLKARVDLVNVADASYVLRDGAGVGVNASQYGQRFGLYGTLGITF